MTVANGWLELQGTVDWQYQKDAAMRAVRDLVGVRGVTNKITIKSRVKAADIRTEIEAAFRRSAENDARRIHVTATDGTVILSGNVHSWSERRQAERAAWAAPGVIQVDDRLAIVLVHVRRASSPAHVRRSPGHCARCMLSFSRTVSEAAQR